MLLTEGRWRIIEDIRKLLNSNICNDDDHKSNLCFGGTRTICYGKKWKIISELASKDEYLFKEILILAMNRRVWEIFVKLITNQGWFVCGQSIFTETKLKA